MLKKIFVNLLLIISLATVALPQTSEPDKKENAAKLKEDAVAFLRETSSDVVNLRTPENRIGFSSELAGLMWFYDEKEARAMFNVVTNDFRQMLQQLDAQINAVSFDEGEDTQIYSVPFLRGAGKQAQMYRKFSKAMSVRQQIAAAISEHDALLAYGFYNDTGAVITNPKIKRNDYTGTYFEAQLLQKIAEQDAAKGLEFGRKSLEKGVNNTHLELLKKIYAKDADAGAAFGEEIVRKLKSGGSDDDENIYLLGSLLDLGTENKKTIKEKPSQKPILSEQDLRDVAELAARRLMNQTPEEISAYSSTVEKVERYSPSRAAQIRQRMNSAAAKSSNAKTSEGFTVKEAIVAPPPPREKIDTDAEAFESLQKLGTEKLSDEARAKAIADAGKLIEKIEDPNAKMMALSGLAVQIGKSGDKETALQIMKQAESFVNQTPRNYMDYIQLWMLAGSYAQIEPDKSFPVLESAVANLNDTISAFIKVGEFIDVNGEIIEDGEVQVSGFGGGGIARELNGAMMMSGSTLKSLAEADFARTRNLTSKFDRTEVRILAKMLVLRSVLGEKTKPEAEPGMIEN